MSLLFFPFLFHSAKSCYWVAHSYSTQFFLAQPNNLYKLVPHRQMLDRETWRQRFAISSYHRTYTCFQIMSLTTVRNESRLDFLKIVFRVRREKLVRRQTAWMNIVHLLWMCFSSSRKQHFQGIGKMQSINQSLLAVNKRRVPHSLPLPPVNEKRKFYQEQRSKRNFFCKWRKSYSWERSFKTADSDIRKHFMQTETPVASMPCEDEEDQPRWKLSWFVIYTLKVTAPNLFD